MQPRPRTNKHKQTPTVTNIHFFFFISSFPSSLSSSLSLSQLTPNIFSIFKNSYRFPKQILIHSFWYLNLPFIHPTVHTIVYIHLKVQFTPLLRNVQKHCYSYPTETKKLSGRNGSNKSLPCKPP